MDFFDIHQSHQIHQHTRELQDVSKSAREANNQLDDLQQRLDRLHLATTAVWELVRERTGLTEQDLLAKIEEVDLRDGRRDGRIDERVTAKPNSCHACDRPNSARRRSCLYCGVALQPGSPL